MGISRQLPKIGAQPDRLEYQRAHRFRSCARRFEVCGGAGSRNHYDTPQLRSRAAAGVNDKQAKECSPIDHLASPLYRRTSGRIPGIDDHTHMGWIGSLLIQASHLFRLLIQ
jgi:hypothetical protein